MEFRHHLAKVGELLVTFRDRVRRVDCWWTALLIFSTFTALSRATAAAGGWVSSWILCPAVGVLSVEIAGPLWVRWSLWMRRSTRATDPHRLLPEGNVTSLVAGRGEPQ